LRERTPRAKPAIQGSTTMTTASVSSTTPWLTKPTTRNCVSSANVKMSAAKM